MSFLPITKEEMTARGWNDVDFVYVSGDAYVDHPSFGAAIITRVLENEGFRVGFLAQPDYKNVESFKEFGRPRLGFLYHPVILIPWLPIIRRQKNTEVTTLILQAEKQASVPIGQ